jgi:hypothetical protein
METTAKNALMLAAQGSPLPKPAREPIWLEPFPVETMTDLVRLRLEVGEPLLLPLAEFQRLRADGLMWEVSQASPSPTTPEIREALLHASPKAQQEANRRLREILAYARGEPVTTSLRSVRRTFTDAQWVMGM